MYRAPIYDRANRQSLQARLARIMPINTFFDESTARQSRGRTYPVRRRATKFFSSKYFPERIVRQQKRTSASSLEPNLRTGDEIFLQNVFLILLLHIRMLRKIYLILLQLGCG